MLGFLNRLFGRTSRRAMGPSLPLELLRRGWKPHKFPDSNVVVILPEAMIADHNDEGVLFASSTSKNVEFSATLHRDFERDRSSAFEFVGRLAAKKVRKFKD